MENTDSYERLSTILNSVGDAVIATDREGLITFMNPVAESLTGWKMEEASGKPVMDIFDIYVENTGNLKKSTFLIEEFQNETDTIGGFSSTSKVNNNTWLVAKSGGDIPIDYTITPIKDEEENPTGIVITFSDVTKYKTKEEGSDQTIGELRRQTHNLPHPLDSKYQDLSNEIRLNLVKLKRLKLLEIHLAGISTALAIRSLAGVR